MSPTLHDLRPAPPPTSLLMLVVLASQSSVMEGLEALRSALGASRVWLSQSLPGGDAVLVEEACAEGVSPWWEPHAEVRLPANLLWEEGRVREVVLTEGGSTARVVNDGDVGLIALRGPGLLWQADDVGLLRDAVRVLAGAFRRAQPFPLTHALEAVLGDLQDPVVVTDVQRVIRWLNPSAEAVFGYPSGALLGRSIRLLFADDRGGVGGPHALLERMPQEGREGSREVYYRRQSGEVFAGESTGGVLRDTVGRPVGFVGVLRDVSARRAEEARRLRTERLSGLGAMAGGLAHDFNNLLTPVLANAVALRQDLASAEGREMAAEIEQAARQAAQLSGQLLTYLGQTPMQPAPLDLAVLVAEEQAVLVAMLPPTVRLEVRLSSAYTVGDVALLRQVLRNLITNAIEALPTDREGTIRVWVGAEALAKDTLREGWRDLPTDTYAVLEVRDDGEGMSERTRERLFDPFFTTRFTGRGLGMAVVQGIVRAHQGDVLVWSQQGEGSRVRVVLPSGIPLPSELPLPLAAPEAGRQVLLVEDEPAVQSVLARLLRREGLVVHLAADGPTALEQVSTLRSMLDLILLDLSLPQLSGVVVLERLRQDLPQTPVIVMSGHRPGELSTHFSALGATFLQKPFTVEDFTQTLRRLLPRQDAGRGQVNR